MSTRADLRRSMLESAETSSAYAADEACLRATERFVETAVATFDGGRRLFACGNGGSMSDAMHLAAEWTGRFRDDRRPLPAMAFSDPATISCIANDFGYAEIFARQIEAHGQSGDMLVVLSTSGDSDNLVRAVARAREMDLTTVGLLGRGGGKLGSAVHIPIIVPRATTADRVQEVHLQVLHAVTDAVERRLTRPASDAPRQPSTAREPGSRAARP